MRFLPFIALALASNAAWARSSFQEITNVLFNTNPAVETREAAEELAKMHLTRSTVSYACDRQIHFAHPKSR